ncbi:MAG: LacI family DNA-binding transcriptional regulator [bacterium]|nr:LacI family DNA-binding transcriptional regulator [bacterium]
MAGIKDIAEKADVSIATVSKALAGKEDVSKATRRKIVRIARHLNYRPNPIARSLVTRKTNTLGLIMPYITNPAATERLRGIQHSALEREFMLISCLSANDGKDSEQKYFQMLCDRQVDGIIIMPIEKSTKDFLSHFSFNLPVVIMSECINHLPYDFVGNDDEEGGRLACEHLVKGGHKHIGYLGNSPSVYSDIEIIKGYRNILEKYHIKEKSNLITFGNTNRDALRKNIAGLMSLSPHPTAIMTWSDMIAFWALEELEKLNINVPRDMALIGYDNIELSAMFRVPLTTVAQSNYQIGTSAADCLIDRIQDKLTDHPRKIIFKPSLIIRESCGLKNTLKNR